MQSRKLQIATRCHRPGSSAPNATMREMSRRVPSNRHGTSAPGSRRSVSGQAGRHASLAKRDIESCVSCHDAQGNDPTCITCHVDPDGIRGTDARTHPAGYMKGERGPWHSNSGATCFNCHTDLNARPNGTKGRGFCGYCHGS